MKYRTKDGDVLDAICGRYYGNAPYNIEDVIAANPGLATHGPVLRAGVIITLPDVEDIAPTRPTIRLWS